MLWPQNSGYGVQRETSGSVLVLNMDVDRDSLDKLTTSLKGL